MLGAYLLGGRQCDDADVTLFEVRRARQGDLAHHDESRDGAEEAARRPAVDRLRVRDLSRQHRNATPCDLSQEAGIAEPTRDPSKLLASSGPMLVSAFDG